MNRLSLREKVNHLPHKPGVYCFKDKNNKYLYIGKAKSLKNRVRSYFHNASPFDPKTAVMVSKIHDFETIVTDSEVEALILEANLVRKNKPKYNINLKDDKSYPYIRVTNETFPRIFPTRRIVHDGSRYFGPYTDAKSMKENLKIIRKIFPVRSCNYNLTEDVIKQKKVKICLDYHIKKCLGPCEGFISQEQYNEMVEQIVCFINGKNTRIVEKMQEYMKKAAENMDFEYAARLRDAIDAIENFYSKQKMVLSKTNDSDIFSLAVEGDSACGVIFKVRDGRIVGRQHFYLSNAENKKKNEILKTLMQQYYMKCRYYPDEVYVPVMPEDEESLTAWLEKEKGKKIQVKAPKIGTKSKLVKMGEKNAVLLMKELMLQKLKSKDYVPYSVKSLQKELHLKILPKKIEAFDISNISGKDAVASLVCFEKGIPKKDEYRMFKIKTVEGVNDFAMIEEVVRRRYSRLKKEKKAFPDLVLIDGGKGQLSAAFKALKELGINEQPLAGIAKRYEEIYLVNVKEPKSLPKDSSALKLLQRIRDEAHRFALQYHRKIRKKRTISSELDNIKGIGKHRKEKLLKHFGSIKKIKESNPDDIAAIPGFSRNIGSYILKILNQR